MEKYLPRAGNCFTRWFVQGWVHNIDPDLLHSTVLMNEFTGTGVSENPRPLFDGRGNMGDHLTLFGVIKAAMHAVTRGCAVLTGLRDSMTVPG